MHDRDYSSLAKWVRYETMPHAKLLTRMREKLERSLDTQLDEDGRVIPAEVEESGAPSRAWCRGYVAYKDGFKSLVEEQRHRDQMVLAARLKSAAPMTEAEYMEGMAEMMAEAVMMLSDDDLKAELARRGIKEPM